MLISEFWFPWVWGGPGELKKLREAACKNNFHLSTSKFERGVPTHDQNIKCLTTQKVATVHVCMYIYNNDY